MKQIILSVVVLFILIYSWKSLGQETIYGSNQGKYINILDTKIYYEEYGNGMPLLLFHGGFGSIHDFQKVIPKLSKHFSVIAIDSPGHGRSEQSDTLSFDLMSDHFSHMIDLLKLDSINIIGYSDGGITALLLAEKRPDKVKKVIASGVNSRMDGIKSEVLNSIDLISPDFIEANQKEWLIDYRRKSPEKDNWKKYITDMKRMYSNNVLITNQTLSKIKAEVLLVFGDRDVIKLEHGIELYQMIDGSRFCVLPDTPHEVFMEKPELISNICIEFLTN
jgi:pimeloyl-ACP methyl ester carboxylesterase